MVSRQFVEMNRLRVEGLLAAFPKLITNTQHTYVETDTVRYVYQPLENSMYLLLITTKASNIVEDLSTLRLLAKVVPDVAGGFQEHAIHEHAFDLIFAFDEVITAGGYREEATLTTIRTNLLMDSHEEKIAMAMKEAKEEQAKAEMVAKAKTLQQQKMMAQRQALMGEATTPVPGRMEGFGGGGYSAAAINNEPNFSNVMLSNNGSDNPYAALQRQAAVPEPPKVIAKTGMKLGASAAGSSGGAKNNSLMQAMAAEDNLFSMPSNAKNAFDIKAAPVKQTTHATPLTLALEEKINVTLNREGAVEACDVKGTLTLTANTEAGAMANVVVNKALLPAEFNFATNPKIDKKPYEQSGVLTLKGGKPYPTQRPVGILRWSYSGEDAAPITINCWPEDQGSGSILVNMELELLRTDLTLQDVNILMPLGTTDAPVMESIDGQYKHDPRAGLLCWHFDTLDASNATGSMEFSIPGSDPDAFFPIQVAFRSDTLLCPIQVVSVTNAQTNAPIPNQTTQSFVPESYQCA